MTDDAVAATNIVVAAVVTSPMLARKLGCLPRHPKTRVNAVYFFATKLAVLLPQQLAEFDELIVIQMRKMRAIDELGAIRIRNRNTPTFLMVLDCVPVSSAWFARQEQVAKERRTIFPSHLPSGLREYGPSLNPWSLKYVATRLQLSVSLRMRLPSLITDVSSSIFLQSS